MIQKHNRHMSFSLYISLLAVTDTMALLVGKFKFDFPYIIEKVNISFIWDQCAVMLVRCTIPTLPLTVCKEFSRTQSWQ